MKNIAYIIFAFVYHIACLLPLNEHKYFCVMTHDASDDSSVGVVIKALKERDKKARFVYVRKEDKKKLMLFKLIFVKSVSLATSKYVFMDNEFLPLADIRIRKGVCVVQLWHGTGTIKKFGHDINEGAMLSRVSKADNKITHLIVNSDYTAKLYKKAFGVGSGVVNITGIPRTDVLFDEAAKEKCIDSFFNVYKDVKGKKLILYAPTFRDDEVKHPKCMIDFDRWVRETDENTVLLVRLHPFVSAFYNNDTIKRYNGRIINVSDYPDVNTLLFVSDILITDYSSIIFEYIALDKPIYFFAYDLDKFSDKGRGFYENYTDYVPGKVVYTLDELLCVVSMADGYEAVREKFFNHAYKYRDGKSTERFLDMLGL